MQPRTSQQFASTNRYPFGSPEFTKVGNQSLTGINGLTSWYKADAQAYTDGAVQFTASDKAYLSIADAAQTGLDPLTGDYSYSFWVNPTTVTIASLVYKTNSVAQIYTSVNGAINIYILGLSIATSAAGVVSAGSWTNLTLVANRTGNLYVYKNGNTSSPVLTMDISSVSGTSFNSSGAFEVGASSNNIYFNGSMDSLGFWNRALTAAEVGFLYNQGQGQVYAALSATEKVGLVSFWNFNEEDGIRYDAHGTNHLTQVFANIIDNTSTLGSEMVVNGTFPDVFTDKVTNGGFASDTTSWTAVGATQLASVSGGQAGNCLELKNPSGSAGYGTCSQSITTVVGVSYTCTFYFKKGTASNGGFRIGTSVGDGTLYTNNSLTDAAWTPYTTTFVAVGTTTYLSLVNNQNTADYTSYFDTISVTMSGWTASNATLTSEAGGQSGNCLQVANVGANYGYATQTVTTVANQNYTLSFYYKNGTGSSANYGVAATGVGIGIIVSGSGLSSAGAWALKTVNFKATSTTTFLWFQVVPNTDTYTMLFDTISLKPLTQTNLNGGFESLGAGETLGSELLSNPGFETAGGGGADVFGTWAEVTTSGTVEDETTIVKSGSHAAKLTASNTTSAAWVQNTTTGLTAGARYKLTFWTRCDGTNAGQYRLYDNTNAAAILANTSTGITGTTYTQVTQYFTTPALCTAVIVYCVIPPATGGIAYFDDVSLKQVTAYAPFLNWDLIQISGTGNIVANASTPQTGTYCMEMVTTDTAALSISARINSMVANHKYKTTYAAKASTTGTAIYNDSPAAAIVHGLTTSYQTFTDYFAASGTYFTIREFGGFVASLYVDDVTLICTEIPSAAGIAAGLAIDGNLCASFNGTTQYLSVADNASIRSGNGSTDFEFGCWVNLNSIPVASQIMGKTNNFNTPVFEYSMCYVDGGLKLILGNGSSLKNTAVTALLPNTWYFVRCWIDSVAQIAYYSINNGTPVGVSIAGFTIQQSTSPLLIGGFAIGNTSNAKVDGAYLIKRLLTASEYTALYNNGKGVKFAGLPSTVSSDATLSFWNLDEYSAGTANVTRNDSKGTNHLTSVGNTPSGQGVNYYEGTVAKWIDQSGNSKTMVQTTQSSRLLYVTNAQNGKPILRGDGLTKNIQNATDLIGTGNLTIATVIKPRSLGGSAVGTILDNGQLLFSLAATGDRLRLSSNYSTIAYSANSSIALGAAYVVIVTRAAGATGLTNFYVNGVLSGTADQASGTPASASPTFIGNRTGGAAGFDGDLFEIAVYNRILNVTEIAKLNRNLRAKWGI